jgi:hypothetical protein
MVEGVVKRSCCTRASPKAVVSVVDIYLPTRKSDGSSEYNRVSSCCAPPLCRSFLFRENAEPHFSLPASIPQDVPLIQKEEDSVGHCNIKPEAQTPTTRLSVGSESFARSMCVV